MITAIQHLPAKQYDTDMLPTRLFKLCAPELAPFLSLLFTRSFADGAVPQSYKAAYMTPLLKKANLGPADARSYRPVSNLSVVSKLLERIVARRLLSYLTSAGLMPSLQSAYRVNHSTKTAVLRVSADILLALDRGVFAALVMLNLSAVFDTVNHTTLLRWLECSYGIRGTALGWVRSYLTGWTQYVRSGSTSSLLTVLQSGVPQGSVLGPVLFLLYTIDLIGLVTRHGLRSHLFADDSRAYGSCPPVIMVRLQNQLSVCVGNVGEWMAANDLQLNADKTEFLWSLLSSVEAQ